jgi:hypothetical protein
MAPDSGQGGTGVPASCHVVGLVVRNPEDAVICALLHCYVQESDRI